MTTPFDQIAPAYAQLWSDTPKGRSQREQIWRELDTIFHPGDRILDLGCGTGDDAVYLTARGIEVIGIDSSPRMVEIAQARGVDARAIPIEDLTQLQPGFTGAISNFGALNCIEDLSSLASALANLLPPGAPFVLCVMGRLRLREPRRWPGRAQWRGITVYYRTSRAIARALAPEFRLTRQVSIGGGDHTFLHFERQP